MKKIINKICSVRVFVLLLCIVFAVSMIKMKNIRDEREDLNREMLKKAGEYNISEEDNLISKDDRYTGSNIREYRTLPSSPELCADMDYKVGVSEVMKELNVTLDNIEGVMIGADADGSGIERYYFTDREIIKKVVDKLEKMELTKMTNMGVDEYSVEEDWDIQICFSDSEYALRVYGEPTNDKRCYRTVVDEVYKVGYYTDKNNIDDDYADIFGSSKQLLFDSDIKEFLDEIIQDNIGVMDMEKALDLCTAEELDLGILFGYKHNPPIYTVDLGFYKCSAYIYVFPIEDTDYSILMLRECSSHNGKPNTKIWRFELHNGEGEYVDMLTATEEEIRNFVK